MNKKLIGHRACGCLRTFFDLLFSLEGKMKHLWLPSGLADVRRFLAVAATHLAELRTGGWEFRWLNSDRTVKSGESLDRCCTCHTSQSGNDYVFSFDRMKEAN